MADIKTDFLFVLNQMDTDKLLTDEQKDDVAQAAEDLFYSDHWPTLVEDLLEEAASSVASRAIQSSLKMRRFRRDAGPRITFGSPAPLSRQP